MGDYTYYEHEGVRLEISYDSGTAYYTRWVVKVNENGSKWAKSFHTKEQAVKFAAACVYCLDAGVRQSLYFDACCHFEGIAA